MPLDSKYGTRFFEYTLEVNSDEVIEELDNKLNEAAYQIAITARQHAKDYETHVDTGRLKLSIAGWSFGHPDISMTYYVGMPRDWMGTVVTCETDEKYTAFIGTDVEYGLFWEIGSLGREALHFIENAMANHLDEYKTIMETLLQG